MTSPNSIPLFPSSSKIWSFGLAQPSWCFNLRPWLPRLYRRMTQVCRAKLGLTSEGVVKKTINKEGKRQVSEPQRMIVLNCLKLLDGVRATSSQIRSGGKRLKETGLYPKEFASTVVSFHTGHKVGFPNIVAMFIQIEASDSTRTHLLAK